MTFNVNSILFMCFVGIIGLLGLIILLVITVVTKIILKKNIKSPIIKGVLGMICFICLYLSLPYFIDLIAAHQKDVSTRISYYNVAAKIAIVPSTKSALYYEISLLNKLNNDGNKAIEAYEKAVKIAGKPDKLFSAFACELYFWKNDKENVLKTCSPNSIAAFYLKNNDFDTALKTSNDYISTLQATNKKNICFARAVKAAINKKKGDKSEFDTDANFVRNECSYYPSAIKYIEADNLFDVYMKNGKYLKF